MILFYYNVLTYIFILLIQFERRAFKQYAIDSADKFKFLHLEEPIPHPLTALTNATTFCYYFHTVACSVLSAYYTDIQIPHTRVNNLHLIAAIVYTVFYGNRTPEGFLGSVRLAVCCCLPVKSKPADVEVTDAVR